MGLKELDSVELNNNNGGSLLSYFTLAVDAMYVLFTKPLTDGIRQGFVDGSK